MVESDAYLRKVNQGTSKTSSYMAKQRMQLLNKKEKVSMMERDMELSQLSNWTGGDSQFNYDIKEREMLKKKQQKVLSDIHKTGLPDREELVDTIVNLRLEKNLHEEEIRLMKVTCARLKKQLYLA